DEPRFSLLGTAAALFEAFGPLDPEVQRRVLALAALVETWPEVAEAVPGVTNLMLMFSAPPAEPSALAARLDRAWRDLEPLVLDGRLVELPVTYGGEAGPHLADVAAYTGLSTDAIVA